MSRSPVSLRLGTRGSKLAMAQANKLKATLESLHSGLWVEITPIRTSGDKGDRDVIGSFVREIQHALLDNRIDLALHCLKDLPTEQVDGLMLAAHLDREDARDTLIGKVGSISELPEGSMVGTGSVRRTSQIASIRPDLRFSPLVGNIDTRLRKVSEGQYDAIILAIAGLKRLGLLDSWTSELKVTPLEFDEMLPAPGQAVLVIETRADDALAQETVTALNDESTRICVTAEREFLAHFGGGCSVPVAAFATVHKGALHLSGLVASPDGSRVLRGTATGDDAAEILFQELSRQGALEIFDKTPAMGGTK